MRRRGRGGVEQPSRWRSPPRASGTRRDCSQRWLKRARLRRQKFISPATRRTSRREQSQVCRSTCAPGFPCSAFGVWRSVRPRPTGSRSFTRTPYPHQAGSRQSATQLSGKGGGTAIGAPSIRPLVVRPAHGRLSNRICAISLAHRSRHERGSGEQSRTPRQRLGCSGEGFSKTRLLGRAWRRD